MKAFSWIEPGDLASAIAAGTQQGALYKAGGVDLADRMKEHLDEPSSLVNLRRLRDLDFVKLEGGVLRLGPLVTLATLATDARIRKGGTECFALAGQNEMHAVFDNDLCAIVHPSAAGTALTALGASLVLRGSSGERTVAADDFFVRPSKDITRETVLGPGELIVEVRVPAGRKSGYVKLMEKQTFDWPLAEAAVALGEDPRVVLGAAAPVPWRARQAEAIVRGRDVDEALAAEAAKAALAGAKPLEHNGYKLPLLEVAVKRALLLAGGAA